MTEMTLPLAKHLPDVSRLAYGCMGLGGGWNDAAITTDDVTQTERIIDTCLASGINLFDHADIYTFGKAEQVFGKVLSATPSLRENMYIQSKCGIRLADENSPKRYDFSTEWITQSVDGILQRLNCDYVDILLLHRPDPLMNVDEVAQTITAIHQSGKAKFFGVSNMNQHQISYLQNACSLPIIVNQLEMSLEKSEFVTQTILANCPSAHGQQAGQSINTGTLEYCQTNHIQLQSWGSLVQGKYSQAANSQACTDVTSPESTNQIQAATTQYVMQLAQEYNASPESIVLAFLTKHPAAIQPVIGTTNLERIKACCQVMDFEITREQWYQLLNLSLGQEVP